MFSDDDIQQVSVRLQSHDNIKGIYLKASMVMVAVRGGCVCVGGWVVGGEVRRYFEHNRGGLELFFFLYWRGGGGYCLSFC